MTTQKPFRNERETCWASWEEWHQVHTNLFEFNSPAVQRKGLALVSVWKSRLPSAIPLMVELTASLVSARLMLDAQRGVDERIARHACSSAVVRFINGVTDQEQKGMYAESVATIAARLSLPDWLVDVRHEATHAQLPALDTLRSALTCATEWLRVNYWRATDAEIRAQVCKSGQVIDNLLFDYTEVISSISMEELTSKSPQKPREIDRVRKKKFEKLEEIASDIAAWSTPVNLRKLVIPGLLRVGILILDECEMIHRNLQFHSSSSYKSQDRFDEACSSLDSLVLVWRPLLMTIQGCHHGFLRLLARHVARLLHSDADQAAHLSAAQLVPVLYAIARLDHAAESEVISTLLEHSSMLGFTAVQTITEKSRLPDAHKQMIHTLVELAIISRVSDRDEHAHSKAPPRKRTTGSIATSSWTLVPAAKLRKLPMGYASADAEWSPLERLSIPIDMNRDEFFARHERRKSPLRSPTSEQVQVEEMEADTMDTAECIDRQIADMFTSTKTTGDGNDGNCSSDSDTIEADARSDSTAEYDLENSRDGEEVDRVWFDVGRIVIF